MNEKRKKEIKAAKLRAIQHCFYMDVYSYIAAEYTPRTARLFTDSPISGSLVDLINEYYWGGNTIPFVAGQVADLLKSKYKKKK
tara:strand:+ start:1395 stop:1646 length:252 start_codon:yes stop_codon:yes gene_type:complete